MSFTKFVYSRVNWLNKSESLTTPLGKTNLNRMDSAIYEIAGNLNTAYDEFSTGKLDKDSAGKLFSETPTWDSDTGIFKMKFYDGTEFQIDFNIEKIPVSFSMDENGVITMKTEDGTEWTADIGKMIPTYVYEDSDTVALSDDVDENGHHIKAELKKNSITDEYLQPNYLAQIISNAQAAENSASNAADSATDASFDAKLAQSYAVGGSGIRESEDTDNSKYYSDVAKEAKETSVSSAQSASTSEENAKASAESASTSEKNASDSAESAKKSEETATEKAESASTSEANAKASAESASTSEKNASASAESAKKSEETATEKAESASTSEANAKASAESASASESSASKSASTASESAESASASETNAKASAESASNSANTATAKASEALQSAESASGYATDLDTAVTESKGYSEDAKKYYEQTKSISEGLNGTLLPMGTITYAELNTSPKVSGYMYNISDDFTSDDNFKDGGGIEYPMGTNVYYTADGYWDCLAGTPVTGVKGDSETSYRRGNVNITCDNVGAIPLSGSSSITGALAPKTSSNIDFGSASYKWHYGYIHRILNCQSICNETTYNKNQLTLPSKSGTIAVTDDIPTKVSALTNDSGYITASDSVATATKATQDGNGNNIASTYLPLSGGYVSGRIYMNKDIVNKEFGYTNYTDGYYKKIATLKITGSYADRPIMFAVTHRGIGLKINYSIIFAGNTSTDPSVAGCYHWLVNGWPLYYYKSDTGTWTLYVKKQGTYDDITITDFTFGSKAYNSISWTWENEDVTELPTGYLTSTLNGRVAVADTASGLSYFTNTSTANVGQDTLTANAIGYVQGYTGTALTTDITDGALYKQVYSSSWAHMIYGDYRSGSIAVRGRNNGTWVSWKRVLDEGNYGDIIDHISPIGTADPLTGRNTLYRGVYSYRTYTGTNAPTPYGAVIGFGMGNTGSAEIDVRWDKAGGGMWYRALRDVGDDWYSWSRLLDETNYKEYCTPDNIGAAKSSHTHSNYATTMSLDGSTLSLKSGSTVLTSVDIFSGYLVPWSTATDSQIARMINAYYNGMITLDDVKSVWSVGDARTISLSAMSATGVGESHVAQTQQLVILDFDKDTLTDANGGKTKALITVQLKNVLSNGTTAETGYMTLNSTTSGNTTVYNLYWETSERRTWCNNVFKSALPSYLKGLVRPVTWTPYMDTTSVSDYCFIADYIDIFGSSCYAYYNTSSNRIKYAGNATSTGSAVAWWSQGYLSGRSYVYYVSTSGTAVTTVPNKTYGICPAFCL